MTLPAKQQPRGALPPETVAFDNTSPPKPAHQGVFVSKESLASFAGASGAVTLIWKAIGILIPGLENNPWSAFVISCVIGAVIYFIHETDPNKIPRNGARSAHECDHRRHKYLRAVQCRPRHR